MPIKCLIFLSIKYQVVRSTKLWKAGVNFINILQAAFMKIDPKSAKNSVKLSVFFALLGSASINAARKMLMKLTKGGNIFGFFAKRFLSKRILLSSLPNCSALLKMSLSLKIVLSIKKKPVNLFVITIFGFSDFASHVVIFSHFLFSFFCCNFCLGKISKVEKKI